MAEEGHTVTTQVNTGEKTKTCSEAAVLFLHGTVTRVVVCLVNQFIIRNPPICISNKQNWKTTQERSVMKKLAVLSTICVMAACQNFAFPENPGQRLDSAEKKPQGGRLPLFAPDRCGENELLYPGDQKNDWICDCGPGYIYYPARDGCFHAYKQGPCRKGQHLILKPGKVVPECVTNPCEEGYARYKGKCYKMDQPNGPCRPVEAGGGIFGVNATTLAVECLKGTDPLSLFNIPRSCPPGSKRDSSNQCRENYNV